MRTKLNYFSIPGMKDVDCLTLLSDRSRISRVLSHVCEYFETSREELCKKKNIHYLVLCKYTAIWLLRNNTSLSDTQISKIFEIDRTTVIYADRKIKSIFSMKRGNRKETIVSFLIKYGYKVPFDANIKNLV